jgi:hypothetical protein
MNDGYEPGKGPDYARRALIGMVCFLGVLLSFIVYVGKCLGWWR